MLVFLMGLINFINPSLVLFKKNFSFIGNKVRHNILNSFIQDWNFFISGLVQYDSSQETVLVFAVALLFRNAVNKNNSRQIFKNLFDDDSLDEENIGYLNPKPRFRCYVKIKLLYIQL